MRVRVAIATVALTALFTVSQASAADLWFHVKVNETGGNQENVVVNLPISIVEAALPLIPQEAMQQGNIRIDSQEFDAVKLRALWQQVQGSPDQTYITVKSNDESIEVAKERGYLIARTLESRQGGSKVSARIPLSVVDALLTGEGNTLNIQAALAALVAEGEGELVTVSDDKSHVRVWIDSQPEAR